MNKFLLNKMENLISMPDEVLLDICDKMDDQSLINFTLSSSRGYGVCSEILIRRKRRKLASILQTYHTAISLSIFDYIIKDKGNTINEVIKHIEEINTPHFISSSDLINSEFAIINIKHPVNQNQGIIDPNKVYPSNPMLENTNKYLDNNDKQYFRSFIDSLIKPTLYVTGINDVPTTIKIPFNSDSMDIYLTNNDGFNVYISDYYYVYSSMMTIRYL